MTVNAHDVVLIGELVGRCPALLSLLQKHLDDHDCLLSHLFMGDVTRWCVERYVVDPHDPDLVCVLRYLNESFEAARPDDRELIGASFLENLPRGTEAGASLRDVIGQALRDHLERYG
jgi:hypothetical protein